MLICPPQPCRFHQRSALIIVISVWAYFIETPAIAQVDDEASSIAEVVVTTRQDIPVAEIKRRWEHEPSSQTDSKEAAAALQEPTKTTFVFSPVELRPISPIQPRAELPLPPEIAQRRKEIEEKSLARVFASGMITDHDSSSHQSDLQLVPSRKGAKLDAAAEMIVAQAPRPLRNLEQQPIQADQLEPMTDSPTTDLELPLRESIISDELIETSPLSEPPLVGDQLQEMVNETTATPLTELPSPPSDGLIEIDNPLPVLVDDSFGKGAEIKAELPIEIHLPNYSIPGGGLDIYMLAPTRFSRPLPNTR